MKKVILAAILLAGATSANAESYNRITLSYDRQNFSANSDYTGTYWGWDHPLNGFGSTTFTDSVWQTTCLWKSAPT